MRKRTSLIVLSALLLCLGVLFDASPALAGDVNSLTLTPSGSMTTFTITGVYNSQTPVTAFSSPGGSYTLTFTLLTSPTSFLEQVPGPGGDFGVAATVDINGVNFASSEAIFFQGSPVDPVNNPLGQGGGFLLCVGEICPSSAISPIAWNILQDNGGQLYTSSASDGISNPSFISGKIALDSASDYGIQTPEPSSLLLLGTGLLGLAGWSRRKLRR